MFWLGNYRTGLRCHSNIHLHKAVTEFDLMVLAEVNNIRNGDKIIKEIKETVSHRHDYADRAGGASELEVYINEHLVALTF